MSPARHVQSRDGTRIACYSSRPAALGDRCVVLANGLGGPRQAWKPLIDYLGDRYRFLTWDYRGLYGSSRPARADGFAIARHVDDLEALLAAEGVARAALVGWSMGVQVCLEASHRRPELAPAMVLLNGTFGRPLDTAVPRGWERLIPGALELAQAHAGALEQVVRKLSRQPEFVGLLKRVGAMAETVDEAEFATVVDTFGTLDVDAFVHNLRALAAHDASRILPQLSVPALVIAGDKDKLTHRGLSQQMVRRIPRAELLVVRGGTHYTAVEFPELVGLRIERFFAERGF